MDMVGEYLGLERDTTASLTSVKYYAHFIPALLTLHRTAFMRQAVNFWRLTERLWQSVLELIPRDPTVAIVDSFPLSVRQFVGAYRCLR